MSFFVENILLGALKHIKASVCSCSCCALTQERWKREYGGGNVSDAGP